MCSNCPELDSLLGFLAGEDSIYSTDKVADFLSKIASKSADNMARIVALFHLLDADLENGIPDEISKIHVKQASEIQWYYLQETLIYLDLVDRGG